MAAAEDKKLTVEQNSRRFQGYLLKNKEIASEDIVALLEALPFGEQEALQLGPNKEEEDRTGAPTRTCPTSHKLTWKGTKLSVRSDQGGQGDGNALTEVYHDLMDALEAQVGWEKQEYTDDDF